VIYEDAGETIDILRVVDGVMDIDTAMRGPPEFGET
jgi:hypothetical protein